MDFNLPERFGLEYKDAEGGVQRPIMIHRAVLGSIERFFGVLVRAAAGRCSAPHVPTPMFARSRVARARRPQVENYAGAFPLWLAPVQVRLLPVSDEFAPYVEEAAAALRGAGLRVEVMGRASIAKMIRTAEKAKTPVMAVVGAKEVAERSLAVRTYADGEVGSVPLSDVVERCARLNRERRGKF